MTTFAALATARRNLVHRIERYLAELETRETVIGQREGDHLARALDRLGVDNFPEGEREMSWAEWASRQPGAPEPHPTVTLKVLRARLADCAGAG
jgi:hypothetical protein